MIGWIYLLINEWMSEENDNWMCKWVSNKCTLHTFFYLIMLGTSIVYMNISTTRTGTFLITFFVQLLPMDFLYKDLILFSVPLFPHAPILSSLPLPPWTPFPLISHPMTPGSIFFVVDEDDGRCEKECWSAVRHGGKSFVKRRRTGKKDKCVDSTFVRRSVRLSAMTVKILFKNGELVR